MALELTGPFENFWRDAEGQFKVREDEDADPKLDALLEHATNYGDRDTIDKEEAIKVREWVRFLRGTPGGGVDHLHTATRPGYRLLKVFGLEDEEDAPIMHPGSDDMVGSIGELFTEQPFDRVHDTDM